MARIGQLGGFAPDALDRLSAYPWPGNIAELAEVAAAAHARAAGARVLRTDLPERLHAAAESAARPRRREEPIQLDAFIARSPAQESDKRVVFSIPRLEQPRRYQGVRLRPGAPLVSLASPCLQALRPVGDKARHDIGQRNQDEQCKRSDPQYEPS